MPPRTVEEIQEDIVLYLKLIAARDMTVRLNRDGPVFSLFGAEISHNPGLPTLFSSYGWEATPMSASGLISSYATIVDTTAGPVTATLPSGLVDTSEQPIVVKHAAGDAAANPVTIVDEDGKTIDGQPSFILNTAKSAVQLLRSDGFWFVVGLFGG